VSPVERARREQPPAGARIKVERDERSRRFAWDTGHKQDAVLLLLFAFLVITLPLTLWFLWLKRRFPEAALELGEDELTFMTQQGARPVRRTVKRADLGAVRVGSMGVNQQGGGYMLTVDVGIERLAMWTGALQPSLTGPELEWIAEQIEAWRG
jgi:hypothetical protein